LFFPHSPNHFSNCPPLYEIKPKHIANFVGVVQHISHLVLFYYYIREL
jgi:hypothetical protein